MNTIRELVQAARKAVDFAWRHPWITLFVVASVASFFMKMAGVI